jgi:xanthine dehydrogenase YagT iron-sulfur-binding subunit
MMISVNGMPREVKVEARLSLLDFLRDDLSLAGTKKGCNQGACGACTVLIDGERALSCLTLAVQCEGREVTTIEGVGTSMNLHPLQDAFVQYDGLQCGYCTPGHICSAIGMAEEVRRGVPSAVTGNAEIDFTSAEIRERMSGNLCRCGSYNGIVEAVRETFSEGSTR